MSFITEISLLGTCPCPRETLTCVLKESFTKIFITALVKKKWKELKNLTSREWISKF